MNLVFIIVMNGIVVIFGIVRLRVVVCIASAEVRKRVSVRVWLMAIVLMGATIMMIEAMRSMAAALNTIAVLSVGVPRLSIFMVMVPLMCLMALAKTVVIFAAS